MYESHFKFTLMGKDFLKNAFHEWINNKCYIFSLKHLTLSESGEDIFDTSTSNFMSLDEDDTKGESFTEIQITKKKPTVSI